MSGRNAWFVLDLTVREYEVVPVFAMIGRDGPKGQERRNRHGDAHVAHVRSLHEQGRILFAGPICESSDGKSVGALIVFRANDESDARRVVDDDPYVAGGVFESVTVELVRQVFPLTT